MVKILLVVLLAAIAGPAQADGLEFARQAQQAEAQRNFEQAVALYTQAIESGELSPQYQSDALHYRGNANYFLRRFEAAAEDYLQSLRVYPKNVYVVLWLYLARSHAGGDAKTELKSVSRKLDLFYWPGPVISMFLGETPPAEVLEAAKDPFLDDRSQREQTCEALFYIGQQALLNGNKEQAAKFFRQAMETGATDFVEYEAARVELERLGG